MVRALGLGSYLGYIVRILAIVRLLVEYLLSSLY